jgi:DNA-binding GntR family transcriptional regulator
VSGENTKLVDVYRVLREGIATGAYRPNEALRAAKIADELGISRDPDEALSRPQRGARAKGRPQGGG